MFLSRSISVLIYQNYIVFIQLCNTRRLIQLSNKPDCLGQTSVTTTQEHRLGSDWNRNTKHMGQATVGHNIWKLCFGILQNGWASWRSRAPSWLSLTSVKKMICSVPESETFNGLGRNGIWMLVSVELVGLCGLGGHEAHRDKGDWVLSSWPEIRLI